MDKAGDILKKLLGEASFKDRGRTASLFHSWPQMVGDRLAAHSRVRDLEGGWLIISVDHPGWYQTLQFKEAAVLERVRSKYPSLKIRGIKVWVEPPKRKAAACGVAEEERVASDTRAGTDTKRDGIPGIDRIKDPELKETLVRLYKDMKDES